MKRIGISALCCATLFLSSCSLLQQQQGPSPQPAAENAGEEQAEPDAEKADKKEGEELEGAVPSSEQQEAARHMLNDGQAEMPTDGEIPEPIETGGYGDALPGGRGLRMGNLAPPEEAASSGENAAPKPNSVEMHGLRSPALPKGLPMDINGKLTPSN